MVKLNNILLANAGKELLYDYDVTGVASKYFSENKTFYAKYTVDVSDVPESISVIPFLSNIMPVAWFVGFDVYISELDKTFHDSLLNLRQTFLKYHPDRKMQGTLYVETLKENKIKGDQSCLLFSGGLDSFESYTRNYTLNPYLVSVHGADIEIEDQEKWSKFKEYNNQEELVNKNKLIYVESNVRDFYTYKVELLVDIGWWGKVQHGMALIGLIAPLSYSCNLHQVIIGSSNTGEIDFGWGSSPNIDEKMKWADIHVIHDGYHLRRTEKIENVIDFVEKNKTPINLRVCYSEYREHFNCNVCAKCQRTILGILLCGKNPNYFGFKVSENIYSLILKNFQDNSLMTEGVKYEWRCLQEKAKKTQIFYTIGDKGKVNEFIQKFTALNLEKVVNNNLESLKQYNKVKFIFRKKFPSLYQIYLDLRYGKL